MPKLSDASTFLSVALDTITSPGGSRFSSYLPLTGESPADSEITQYEGQALERLNAATIDVDPGALSSGLPPSSMDTASQVLTQLSDTLTLNADRLDHLLGATDERVVSKLHAGAGGRVVSGLRELASLPSDLVSPVQSAASVHTSIATKLSNMTENAKGQIEDYVTGGKCKGAPVFHFDWSSGGELVQLGDRLATDIIPELHNLANPGDPIRGVTSLIPLITAPEDPGKSQGLSTSEARSIAERFIKTGLPYSWGAGHDPAAPGATMGVRDGGEADRYGDFNKIGYDCSGLSRAYIYDAYGVDIGSGSTYDQYGGLAEVDSSGRRPGDLYFPPKDGGGVNLGHVQVYLGDGAVLEARESGTELTISPIKEGGDYRRPHTD